MLHNITKMCQLYMQTSEEKYLHVKNASFVFNFAPCIPKI